MYRKCLFSLALALVVRTASAQNDYKQALAFAESQTNLLLSETAKSAANHPGLASPRTVDNTGNLVLVNTRDWCSGFFPGNLWLLYEFTGYKHWRDVALPFTTAMEAERTNGGTHDLGFMVYNSVGNAYRLTHKEHYKDVIIEAARTLMTRFNPKAGVIKSWDGRKEWQYPVIIDNMMNLEMLFEATKLSGDSSFYKTAVIHANTTLKNHFRKDNSSFHVIDYDPATGAVLHRQTHQGYADSSAWARGQAWGLYGFTMCYRETHNPAYLTQAEKIAEFIFNNPNLPEDLIPYWDYNAPDLKTQSRDASAAAITASALYELSTYSKSGKKYRQLADKIVHNLHTAYQPAPGHAKGFLLLHSTGHHPANSEVDVPIIYADYYYLEALLRQKRLALNRPVIDETGRYLRVITY